MKHNKFLIAVILITFYSNFSVASSTKVEELIRACSELVGIYKAQDKKFLLAAQATSLSEALRAGYCRGVVEQYANKNYRCSSGSWFKMAKLIAKYQFKQRKPSNEDKLLKIACDGS